MKLNLKYGSHFIKGPGVIIGGDGESGFGHNEASSIIDNDLKDRSSVISNLSYHKRLFGVIRCLTQETGENIFQPFNREYKIRSIKAFYLARKFGRKYALNYWNELRNVKAQNIALLYPIYGLLVLLPTSLIDYPVKKIENSLTYYRNQKSKKYSKND
ncbi:MAG: hypothetical protein EOO47_09415 [Flavobacterium sp.]|nr:MAG: hypothetical protein EOO47_09415 [Flavobacterium sp.]